MTITKYTKHYYIGSERVASALGSIKSLGMLCEGLAYADAALIAKMNNKVEYAAEVMRIIYDTFEKDMLLPAPFFYNEVFSRCDLTHYQDMYHPYWYHPDHLGSSSYITNLDGEINQHMEYLPFGELLVEEHLNSYNSPFKFSALELDSETGNYYATHRYYNPKWSVFLSVDPLYEQSPSWTPYRYGFNNPVRYIDPDGLHEYSVNDRGQIILERETKDKFDMVYTKENYENREGGIKLKDQGIMSGLLEERCDISQYHFTDTKKQNPLGGIYTTSQNKDEMLKTFMFFSENTDVEWTLQGNGDSQNFNIALGRLNNVTDQAIQFTGVLDGFNDNNLLFHYHNHSGTAWYDFNASGKDLKSADYRLSKSPNAEIYIYMPQISKDNYNKVRPRSRPAINHEPGKMLRLDRDYLKWFGY